MRVFEVLRIHMSIFKNILMVLLFLQALPAPPRRRVLRVKLPTTVAVKGANTGDAQGQDGGAL